MLAIEVDGASHIDKEAYDTERTKNLLALDIQVLRYSNDQVLFNLEEVKADLIEQIKQIEDSISPLSHWRRNARRSNPLP